MLILTRKPHESIYIGDDIKVTVMECKNGSVRLGVDAPPEIIVDREEIRVRRNSDEWDHDR